MGDRRDRGERNTRRDGEKDTEGIGREKEILERDRGKETEEKRQRKRDRGKETEVKRQR